MKLTGKIKLGHPGNLDAAINLGQGGHKNDSLKNDSLTTKIPVFSCKIQCRTIVSSQTLAPVRSRVLEVIDKLMKLFHSFLEMLPVSILGFH